MFGFFLGTACLVGFIAMARKGHHHHHRGHWGGGWGRTSHRGGGRWGFFLRGLFERLDTTPGQEKAIGAAAEALREAFGRHRAEGRASREAVAKAMRGPGFDEVLFGEMWSRHDVAIEDLRKAFSGAFAEVHEALDDKQRERLADLIESGPMGRGAFGRGAFGRGPYRDAHRGC